MNISNKKVRERFFFSDFYRLAHSSKSFVRNYLRINFRLLSKWVWRTSNDLPTHPETHSLSHSPFRVLFPLSSLSWVAWIMHANNRKEENVLITSTHREWERERQRVVLIDDESDESCLCPSHFHTLAHFEFHLKVFRVRDIHCRAPKEWK